MPVGRKERWAKGLYFQVSRLKFEIWNSYGMCLFLFYLPVATLCLLLSPIFSTPLVTSLSQFISYMPNLIPSHRPCYQCLDCPRSFKSSGGLTQHRNSAHRVLTPLPEDDDDDENTYTYRSHPFLNGKHCWFFKFKQRITHNKYSCSLWRKRWQFTRSTTGSTCASAHWWSRPRILETLRIAIGFRLRTLSFCSSTKFSKRHWCGARHVASIHLKTWRERTMDECQGPLQHNWFDTAWRCTMEDIHDILSRSAPSWYSAKMDDRDIWALYSWFTSCST